MENLENNIITTTETVTEAITESVPDAKSGVSPMLVVGLVGAAGAAIWELIAKPAFKWGKKQLVKGKEKLIAKKQKKEEDEGEKALNDIPEIDE